MGGVSLSVCVSLSVRRTIYYGYYLRGTCSRGRTTPVEVSYDGTVSYDGPEVSYDGSVVRRTRGLVTTAASYDGSEVSTVVTTVDS